MFSRRFLYRMNTLLLKLVDKIKMISIVRNQLFMKRKQIKRDIFHFVLHAINKNKQWINRKCAVKKLFKDFSPLNTLSLRTTLRYMVHVRAHIFNF